MNYKIIYSVRLILHVIQKININRISLFLLMIFTFVTAAFEALTIYLVSILVRDTNQGGSVTVGDFHVLHIVAFSISMSLVLRLVLTFKQQLVAAEFATNLAENLFQRILNLDFVELLATDADQASSTIAVRSSNFVRDFLSPFIIACSNIMLVAIYVGFLFYLNFKLTLIFSIIVFSIYIFISLLVSEKISIFGERGNIAQTLVFNEISKLFANIKSVMFIRNRKWFALRFRNAFLRQKTNEAMQLAYANSSKFVIENLLFVAFFVLYLPGKEIWPDLFKSGLVFLFIGQRTGPLVQQIFMTYISFVGNVASAETVVSSLDKKYLDVKDDTGTITRVSSVDVSEIGFNHLPDVKPMSFSLLPGDTLLISGPSGSGKTTLVDTLLGLRKIDYGFVYFNGLPLGSLNHDTIVDLTAYVSQNASLFNGTILDNILCGRDYEEDRLRSVFHICLLDEFLVFDSLYENKINTLNPAYSGGQLQRIYLARCLYDEFSILVLDEPTSALDHKTSEKILRKIQEAYESCILIVISHQPDMVSDVSVHLELGLPN